MKGSQKMNVMLDAFFDTAQLINPETADDNLALYEKQAEFNSRQDELSTQQEQEIELQQRANVADEQFMADLFQKLTSDGPPASVSVGSTMHHIRDPDLGYSLRIHDTQRARGNGPPSSSSDVSTVRTPQILLAAAGGGGGGGGTKSRGKGPEFASVPIHDPESDATLDPPSTVDRYDYSVNDELDETKMEDWSSRGAEMALPSSSASAGASGGSAYITAKELQQSTYARQNQPRDIQRTRKLLDSEVQVM
jgi:hypothetical protein